jgi:hypothetical protein
MVLKDILAISGEPGLFKFLAQGKNAIIVEHLETKKRSTAFSSARVSTLEEISIFTSKEDTPLSKVFNLIFEKENGGPAIDFKSDPEKLKTWFGEVLPEYDRERVYVSDIKKLVHWYNILHSLNLLVKEEPEKKEEPAPEKKPAKEKETTQKKESSPKKKPSSEEKKPAPKKKSAKPKSE